MSQPRLEHQPFKISQLITEYRAGRIVIPEFQREYVWRESKAARLLDSLYRGYPVSSILLWESDDRVRERTREPRPQRAASISWLIDGQQRVTTLSRCMSGEEGIDVLFSPDDEEFARDNVAFRQKPGWVRVAHLWDDELYRNIRRNLPPGRVGETYEGRYDRVRRILDYEIPAIRMVGHSFESAVEAFTRINTLGVKLRQSDIESARIAAHHSGFIANDVVPFLDRIQKDGFKRLSIMHLFLACAFVAQPDLRNRTPLYALGTREVKRSWGETERATKAAINLVRAELGLVNMDILWSGALLVPVIALCAIGKTRELDAPGIAGWLAAAALFHRYSKSSGTALLNDLRACRQCADPVGALLSNIRRDTVNLVVTERDFDGAIADKSGLLAAYVACHHKGAKDVFSKGRVAFRSDIDRHHILPRAQFPDGEQSRADCIANIAFITGAANKSIGAPAPEVYLPKIPASVLESQCIPLDPDLWRIEAADEFWEARKRLLAESFNEYLRSVLPKRRGLAASASAS